jgi:hypothetical protein
VSSKIDQAVFKWVTVLCRAYDKEADEAMIEAYSIGLEGLSADDIEIGSRAAIKGGGQFMPSPSRLREMCGGLSPKIEAEEAWLRVCKASGQHHGSGLDFGARGNAALRLIGGRGTLSAMLIKDEPFVRRRFVEAYIEYGGVADLADRGKPHSRFGEAPVRISLEEGHRRKALPSAGGTSA